MVFKAFVKTILRQQKEPDNLLLANSVSSLKNEIANDLIEAFELSSDLIKNNQSLFNESMSFLDFLIKICGVKPKENQSLNEKLNFLQLELDKEKLNACNLNAKLIALQSELEREKLNVLNLKGDVNHLTRELENCKKQKRELEDCKKENECLVKKYHKNDMDFSTELDECKQNYAECQHYLSIANTELKQLREAHEQLKEDFQLRVTKENLKMVSEKDEQIELLKSQLQELNESLQSCESSSKENLKMVSEKDKQIEQLQSELESARKNIVLLKKEYGEIGEREQYLIAKNNEIQQTYNQKISELENLIFERNSNIGILVRRANLVPTLMTSIQNMDSELNQLYGLLSEPYFKPQSRIDQYLQNIQSIHQKIKSNEIDMEIEKVAIEKVELEVEMEDPNEVKPSLSMIKNEAMEQSTLKAYVMHNLNFEESDWEEKTILKLKELSNLVNVYDYQRKSLKRHFHYMKLEPNSMFDEIKNLMENRLSKFDELQNYILDVHPEWENLNWKKEWINVHKEFKAFLEKYSITNITSLNDFFQKMQENSFYQNLEDFSENFTNLINILNHYKKGNLKDLQSTLDLEIQIKDRFKTWYISNTRQEWNDENWHIEVLNYFNQEIQELKNKNSNIKQRVESWFKSQSLNWDDDDDWIGQVLNYLDKTKTHNDSLSVNFEELKNNLAQLNQEKAKWRGFYYEIMSELHVKEPYHLDENLDAAFIHCLENVKDKVNNPKRKLIVVPGEASSEECAKFDSQNPITNSELKDFFYTLYRYHFKLLFETRKPMRVLEQSDKRKLKERIRYVDALLAQHKENELMEMLLTYVKYDIGTFLNAPAIKLKNKGQFVKTCMDDTKAYLFSLITSNSD